MNVNLLLLSFYALLTVIGGSGLWRYRRKRRHFLREVSPIFKEHLGFSWEPITWRDHIFYRLDGYKLKRVKENFVLLPITMRVRYQNLVWLRNFYLVCLGLSCVIVCFGYMAGLIKY